MIGRRFVKDVRSHCMADEAAERYKWDGHMLRERLVANWRIDGNEGGYLEAVYCAEAEDLEMLYFTRLH